MIDENCETKKETIPSVPISSTRSSLSRAQSGESSEASYYEAKSSSPKIGTHSIPPESSHPPVPTDNTNDLTNPPEHLLDDSPSSDDNDHKVSQKLMTITLKDLSSINPAEIMRFNVLADSPKSLFSDSDVSTPSSLTRTCEKLTSSITQRSRRDSRESWFADTPSELHMSPLSPAVTTPQSITRGVTTHGATTHGLTHGLTQNGHTTLTPPQPLRFWQSERKHSVSNMKEIIRTEIDSRELVAEQQEIKAFPLAGDNVSNRQEKQSTRQDAKIIPIKDSSNISPDFSTSSSPDPSPKNILRSSLKKIVSFFKHEGPQNSPNTIDMDSNLTFSRRKPLLESKTSESRSGSLCCIIS